MLISLTLIVYLQELAAHRGLAHMIRDSCITACMILVSGLQNVGELKSAVPQLLGSKQPGE